MVENTKNEASVQNINLNVAEPAAIGLFGLAVAAFVIGAGDLGLTSSLKSLMIPWVLMFGATAQLIASLMEFKRNNIFGATVFGVYSMAMYSIALTLIISIFGGSAFDISHYGYGLIALLVFTLIATAASVMTNKALFSILIAVDLALIALIPHYLTGTSPYLAGVFLMVTSVLSFYTAGAILINTMAQKSILPLGSPIYKP